ncbi:calmodulin-like [Bradysia coprophila]|uniref:calmodulin-like n=1 Tax=Bradysia coprophila TaxID=38358 RepID=UPI00187DBE98|nr:calmodulin-like [Bradysia coprophila]
MLFVPAVFRKLNPLTVESKWKVLSVTLKNFSSSSGFSPEEIERFRKVFRTMPSYEESITSQDLPQFYRSINYIKSMETYLKHAEYTDKIFGGRITTTQLMTYLANEHDSRLLMHEYLKTFDRNNDGYISKDEFEMGIGDIKVHDPRFKHVSYEDFLKQADTNKDGRVSVSECRDWVNKNLVLP